MTTKIICVVDNQVMQGSKLKSEHGLAFWIETDDDVLLFDTGQSTEVLEHNIEILGLRLQDIDYLALSHAHYDHTGGLEAVLSNKDNLEIFANPDILRPRYALRDGDYESIGMAIDPSKSSNRVRLKLCYAPNQIFPKLWTTGVISKRPEPQGSSPHHFVLAEGGWQSDPYLDDMSLVLITDTGLVLICGCCHAGLLNTLFHVELIFGGPISTVIGGTHLISADDNQLDHIISVLETHFQGLTFYLNHCTGQNGFNNLAGAFGSQVKACPAGTSITF